ncbi:xylulokinase [Actinocatenispora rupis]|uniref:xylulokinase n=1 Tax=Actinocatenispora rupis TaxID=519421 RepID=UPI0019455817|nr:FGGY family carbohydrate kinase [Actinocatenispora rupis]
MDIGTGSAKAVLFDPDRGVLGRGTAEYPVATPRPGYAEQDPADWWAGAVAAIRAATGGAPVDAVAVSGQGAAVVLTDAAGEPVRPALIHLDQRADREAEALRANGFAAGVRRASGNDVGSWNVAAKLCWLRAHEPAALDRAHRVTSAAGFVLARLTGRGVQSVSDAGISDLFDLTSRGWSRGLAAGVGLDPALLPTVAAATEDVGTVLPAAAEATGLATTTRVRAGGEDTSSAALAAGVLTAGAAYLSLGTAGVVGVAVPAGVTDEPRLLSFPHVREGLDLLSGSMTSAGSALRWWSDVTGVPVADLLAEAETADAGQVTFVPYLAGELHPVNDPHARGILAGLSLATGRAELTRGILAGAASAVAHNLDVCSSAGAPATLLSATGRPTASPAWMREIADATGVPVEVVGDDGAAVGDAMIAAAASDAELAGLVRAHRHVTARYEPDPARLAPAVERRAAIARLYQASRGGAS